MKSKEDENGNEDEDEDLQVSALPIVAREVREACLRKHFCFGCD